MYTARCTSRVLEALGLPAVDSAQSPSTALGDWHVDFIHTRMHRLVHFVSDRSLLSVVVPVKTLKTALDRHVLSLRELLGALGVKPAMIQAETGEMEQRAVASTRSQSVLASMGDLAIHARCILEQTPSINYVELSLELAQVPCGPLGMRVPAEASIGLLLARHSSPAQGERGA
jgi:hypothetical protein